MDAGQPDQAPRQGGRNDHEGIKDEAREPQGQPHGEKDLFGPARHEQARHQFRQGHVQDHDDQQGAEQLQRPAAGERRSAAQHCQAARQHGPAVPAQQDGGRRDADLHRTGKTGLAVQDGQHGPGFLIAAFRHFLQLAAADLEQRDFRHDQTGVYENQD